MADGPAGKVVGRVTIRVAPDTSDFREELKAQLEKMDDDFEVAVNPDFNGFAEKIRAAVLEAEAANEVDIPVDMDRDALAAISQDLRDALDVSNINAIDGAAIVAPLRDALNEVADDTDFNVEVTPDQDSVDRLRTTIDDALNVDPVDVQFDPTGANEFGQILDENRNKADEMYRSIENAAGSMDRLTNRTADLKFSFDGITNETGQIPAHLQEAAQSLGDIEAGWNSQDGAIGRVVTSIANGVRWTAQLRDRFDDTQVAANRAKLEIESAGEAIAKRWGVVSDAVERVGSAYYDTKAKLLDHDHAVEVAGNRWYDVRRGVLSAGDSISNFADRVANAKISTDGIADRWYDIRRAALLGADAIKSIGEGKSLSSLYDQLEKSATSSDSLGQKLRKLAVDALTLRNVADNPNFANLGRVLGAIKKDADQASDALEHLGNADVDNEGTKIMSDNVREALFNAQDLGREFDNVADSAAKIGPGINDSIRYTDSLTFSLQKTKQAATDTVSELEKMVLKTQTVKLEAEDTDLRNKITAAKAELEKLKQIDVDIQFDADAAPLQAKYDEAVASIERLKLMQATPEVDLEIAKFQAQIAAVIAELNALSSKEYSPRVSVDIDAGELKIAALEAKLAKLALERHKVNVDLDTDTAVGAVSKFVGKTIGLFGDLGDKVSGVLKGVFTLLPGSFDRVFSEAQNAFKGVAAAGDEVVASGKGQAAAVIQLLAAIIKQVLAVASAILTLGAISFGLIVIGAGISAAWGAIATAIAAIPGLIAAVAVAFGVVALGMDGIKKAAATLKPEFDALKASVSATFEKGLTPVFERLAVLFPNITTGMNGVATSLIGITSGVADLVIKANEAGTITTIFNNVKTALDEVKPGIENIVTGFLKMAELSGPLDVVVGVINTFGEAFRTNVTELIGNGQMERAFQGLGTVLNSLTQGFVDLVSNGISLFAGAAPGVTSFLDKISEFFNKFDWERLGVAVGQVFDGLGEALAKIDPGTIEAITTAFEGIGKAFQDPGFQDSLASIIDAIPTVITLLGKLATWFVNIAGGIADFITFLGEVGGALDTFGTKLSTIIGVIPTVVENGFGGIPGEIGRWLGLGETEAETGSAGIVDGLGGNFLRITPETDQAFSGMPGAAGRWFDALRGQAETGSAGAADATSQGLGAVPPAADAALTPLGQLAALAGLQPQFVTAFGALPGIVTQSLSVLITSVLAAFEGMTTQIQLQLDGVALAITAGTLLWSINMQLGIEQMALAVTTGFVAIKTAVDLGLADANLSIIAGVAVWALSIQLGFTNMALAVTTGFATIKTNVTAELAAINLLIIAGVAVWALSVTTQFALIVTAITAGMLQASTVIQTSLTAITVLWQTSLAAWVVLVQTAMLQLTTAIAEGMSQANIEVTNGVTRMIQTLESAVPQFRAAGENMGRALAEGLASQQGAVEAAAADLANAAAAATAAAAQINSPSRVFIRLGEYTGEGYEVGIENSENGVVKAIKNLVVSAVKAASGLSDALSPVTEDLTSELSGVIPERIQISRSVDFTREVEAPDFGNQPIEVSTTVELDGDKIGKSVRKYTTLNDRRGR